MHYTKRTGCVENTICIEIKQAFKDVLEDDVLEKYPVSFIRSYKK